MRQEVKGKGGAFEKLEAATGSLWKEREFFDALMQAKPVAEVQAGVESDRIGGLGLRDEALGVGRGVLDVDGDDLHSAVTVALGHL